ncbi:MAG: DegT/DnrJ/EryC1/StrS family aminotransferase [Elusimicrobia bacterium]|nr:DegT/DnrJ/EryC1/StrS family aminotransferase [Elusimicrobiota bacterium]
MRIPFGTIAVTPRARRLIDAALDSNRLSSGRLVGAFERRFARLAGVREAVAVSSGTDADTLALAVLHDLGARRGDEVIVPALSFAATGNAVLHAGFTPVFVDVERDTLNIDPARIARAVTRRTRAIMPVHLMGKPANMDAVNRIARKRRLLVVEDAAEAHGALYKGRPAGSLGDLGAFSTYIAHAVTTIEGGVVTTDRRDLAAILRSLRSHGRACKCGVCALNAGQAAPCPRRFRFGKGTDIRFVFERIGYSSKMNELEAAVGLGSLDRCRAVIARRRRNLLAMMRGWRRFAPHLLTFREERHERIGPHAFPILLGPDAPFSRDELGSFLEKNGIETRHLFSSLPTQCPGFRFLGYRKGDFPEAEYVGANGLHVGVHQDLGPEHVAHLLETVERFLSARGAAAR